MHPNHVLILNRDASLPEVGASAGEEPGNLSPEPRRAGRRPLARRGRFPAVPLLMGVFAAGLLARILDGVSVAANGDFRRVAPVLATGVVSAVLVGMGLALASWRGESDPLCGRLAIAVPCLFLCSQSISSSVLSSKPPEYQFFSMLSVGFGLVGSYLLAGTVAGRPQASGWSLRRLAIVSLLAAASVAVALDRATDGHDAFRTSLLATFATVVFPALWAALGVTFLLRSGKHQMFLRRSVGAGLLLLVAPQLLAPPSLGVEATGRALAAESSGLVAALSILGGLAFTLWSSCAAQSRRLIVAEFTVAETTSRLVAEHLLAARKRHDLSAALLSIEAVIKLLERSDEIDAPARHRLCVAATDELLRLRSDGRERVEADLREVIEPVVDLANAAGASVTMRIRTGLPVDVGPALVDVVRNLITNALRHGRTNEVVIEGRRLDLEFLELTVSDTGPGVPAARRFDLFEPGRSSGGEESSGLGLHSARSLMREIGGDLQLDRSCVSGARFIVKIPACSRPGTRPTKE